MAKCTARLCVVATVTMAISTKTFGVLQKKISPLTLRAAWRDGAWSEVACPEPLPLPPSLPHPSLEAAAHRSGRRRQLRDGGRDVRHPGTHAERLHGAKRLHGPPPERGNTYSQLSFATACYSSLAWFYPAGSECGGQNTEGHRDNVAQKLATKGTII